MNLQLIKTIIILPGTVLVFIPGAILWLLADSPAAIAPAGLAQPRFWIGIILAAAGLVFAVWTVRLFLTAGEGTPAPWDPPKRLVVRGPYRHVRNPMITSVVFMLGAESLFFGSWHLAGWMLVFFSSTRSISHWSRSRVSNGGSAKTIDATRRTCRVGYPVGGHGMRPSRDATWFAGRRFAARRLACTTSACKVAFWVLVNTCLTRRSRLTAGAEFSFLVDRDNLKSVPYVAEVPLLAGVREKGRSEHGDTFAPCPAAAVIGNPV